MFHQHQVELLFAAFAAYLAPLLMTLVVHMLPFWVGLDKGVLTLTCSLNVPSKQ